MFDYPTDLAAFAPPSERRSAATCKRVFNREIRGQEASRARRMLEHMRGLGIDADLSRKGLERLDPWFATLTPELDPSGGLTGSWTTWALDVALAIGEVVQREWGLIGEWLLFPAIRVADMRCTPTLDFKEPGTLSIMLGWAMVAEVHHAAGGETDLNPPRPDTLVSSMFDWIDTYRPSAEHSPLPARPVKEPEIADESALERYRAAMARGTAPLEGFVLLADTDRRHLDDALDDEDPNQPPNPKLIRFLDDFYARWPDVPMGLDVEVPPPYEYNLYEMITGNQVAIGLTHWAPEEMSDDLVLQAHKHGLLVYDTVTGQLV